jgi:regulator of ribonuclease activity A
MMPFSTPDLCDAYAQRVRVVAPIFRSFGGQPAFSGPIFTVKCFEDNSLVKEHLSQAGHGQVMVVDGGGSLRCALLGDLLAAKALENGWAGVVVHGCVRDVDEIAAMALGVQALAAIPLKSERKGQGEYNLPVTFGGVTFYPSHFIYADRNGIIVADQRLK